MSSVRRLDDEKLRTRRVIATAALTIVAIAFLLLSDASADAFDPGSATPPVAGSSYQAADEQVPPAPVQTASTARPVRPQEE